MTAPSASSSAPADPAAAPQQAKTFDPKDKKFDRVKAGQFWISYEASAVPPAGAVITPQSGFGKTIQGLAYEFTLSFKVLRVSTVTRKGAALDVEVVSSSPFTMATGQQPSTFTVGRKLSVQLTLLAKP